MKIAYFSNSAIPSRAANSIHVMKMCQALAHSGYETVLFYPDKAKETDKGIDDLHVYYDVEKNFTLKKLIWPNMKAKSYIYAVAAAFTAKKEKFALVFGRNLSACLAGAYAGLPVMFESHAPIADSGKTPVWLFERLIRHKNFKKFIVITEALKNYYLDIYPHLADKICVAADGADPIKEDIVPVELPNKETRLQAGYIGSLYKGRGIDILAALAEALPMVDFHIVGGQEADIAASKPLFEKCGNAVFYGHQPPNQVGRFLKAFDVLLAPYQKSVSVYGGKGDTGRWMSPLKIFEYMSAAKAMIASDVPVLREVLEPNVNALLAEPTDVEAWKRHLEYLRDNPQERERIGEKAKQIFLERYTWRARAAFIMRDVHVG